MNVKRIATLLQINNELGNIYGILLEETAHYYLSRGEYTYAVHELIAKPSKRIDTSKGPTTHKVTWPKCEETVFFEHVSRIEKIEFGKYYRPRSKIYETIDSFVVLEDVSFLDSKLKGPALVLIQVTVSKTHTVNGAKVKELQTDVSAKLGRAQPLQCIFLFATRKYPHGVHTFQTPKKADSTEYQPGYGPKLVEYSLALERDFDEIWRDVEHEHFA